MKKREITQNFITMKVPVISQLHILLMTRNRKKELDKELEEKMGTDLGMLIGRQVNVSLFMRRMLVRRYESSVAAFRDSLNSMIDSSEHILKWIEKRDKVPVYKKAHCPTWKNFTRQRLMI